MADNDKGTAMVASSCDWTRSWLPLLGDSDEGLACDGGDLGAEDQRLLEQHLTECPRCRRYQAELKLACSVLSLVAADLTTEPHAPSLWPEIEERIKPHHQRARSWWVRALRASCPDSVGLAADRLVSGCRQVLDNLPLQLAWIRDSVGEFLADEVAPALARGHSPSGSTDKAVFPRFGMGLGLTAAAVVMVVLLAVTQHSKSQREARIAAAAAPLPSVPATLPGLTEASEDVVVFASSRIVSRASNSLSLTSSAGSDGETSMGQATAAKTAATVTTATFEATSATRFDFDLEDGTPMPPDTRTGKPAY